MGPVSSKETQPASEISANNKRGRFPTEESIVNENEQSPRELKRHGPIGANLPEACAKRLKISHDTASFTNTHLPPKVLVPVGTQWENNSCAYDAVCTVLFNVWCEDPVKTTLSWNELDNDLLNSLTTAFESHVDILTESTSGSLERIRDEFRHRLAMLDNEFTFGIYASVHAITNQLLVSQELVMRSVRRCRQNHAMDDDERFLNSCEIMTIVLQSTLFFAWTFSWSRDPVPPSRQTASAQEPVTHYIPQCYAT